MNDSDLFAIRDQALSLDEVFQKCIDHSAGAIIFFVGTVRTENKSRTVAKLEYEAYDSMVVKEFEKLAKQAKEKWSINKIVIHHRKGVLNPGDIAVIIGVSTPHRKESFEACSYIIEELKKTAPIWKKEIYDDGQEWLEAHP